MSLCIMVFFQKYLKIKDGMSLCITIFFQKYLKIA